MSENTEFSQQHIENVPQERDISFSVIVPTLNEADIIHTCIDNIRSIDPEVEIIIADGGSNDNTASIARKLCVRVLNCEPGRGGQCNSGAAVASGDILVFLHADTLMPAGAFKKLAGIFSRSYVGIGTFRIKFDTNHWLLRLFSFLSLFDMGLFRFGDQTIVVRKSLFHTLGGFPDWNLFEDLALIRKARKLTKIHRFPVSVTASARRFTRNGIIKQQLFNIYYTVQFLAGASPVKLAEKYYRNGSMPYQYDASLVIFLRFPRLGKVKTRLASSLGNEAATKFYRICAESILKEAEKLPPEIDKYIYYAGRKDKKDVKRWVGLNFRFRPQQAGDIGAKLKAALYDRFRQGSHRVIIIATDVPDLSAGVITEAISALSKADLVIGPSADGGYYLIGMNKPYPALFDNISWSTDVVYQQTITAARNLGLRVFRLEVLDDIDTVDDLHRWIDKTAPEKDNRVTSEARSIVV